MQDKDMMHDLLNSEKYIISGYSTGMTETSCENLKKTLMENYQKVQTLQYNLFNTMNQKGWYPTKDADSKEVQQVKDDASKLLSELQ